MQTDASIFTVDQDNLLATTIPWWHTLDPAITTELLLPPLETLSTQTYDVIVIGGGVAGLSAAISAHNGRTSSAART